MGIQNQGLEYYSLPLLICQESDVMKILLSLNTNKVCGPDGVTARLLCEASSSIVPSLTRLFNSSLALGKLPCK